MECLKIVLLRGWRDGLAVGQETQSDSNQDLLLLLPQVWKSVFQFLALNGQFIVGLGWSWGDPEVRADRTLEMTHIKGSIGQFAWRGLSHSHPYTKGMLYKTWKQQRSAKKLLSPCVLEALLWLLTLWCELAPVNKVLRIPSEAWESLGQSPCGHCIWYLKAAEHRSLGVGGLSAGSPSSFCSPLPSPPPRAAWQVGSAKCKADFYHTV